MSHSQDCGPIDTQALTNDRISQKQAAREQAAQERELALERERHELKRSRGLGLGRGRGD